MIGTVRQHQLTLLSRYAHNRKRATLPFAKRLEQFERFRRNGQHVALLALVAPDFFWSQARLFQRDRAQFESSTAARVVRELGEGIAQAACAYVVNGEDRIFRLEIPAMVDYLLRAAFNFGVAALHRVKIKLSGVRPGGHRAGGAAAHAYAHAGATELDQQAARRELDFLGLRSINHA